MHRNNVRQGEERNDLGYANKRLLTVPEERLSTDVLSNLFVRSSNVFLLFPLTIRKIFGHLICPFFSVCKVVIGAEKKIYAWRRCNERVYPECTGIMSDREKQGTISAMFGGCITNNGVGTITPINGNMNSAKYIETLDNHL
jgi:hypothetical protein